MNFLNTLSHAILGFSLASVLIAPAPNTNLGTDCLPTA